MNKQISVFLVMLQHFEKGQFSDMAICYNQLNSGSRIGLILNCFEKNIYSINATTRIAMMSHIFKYNA